MRSCMDIKHLKKALHENQLVTIKWIKKHQQDVMFGSAVAVSLAIIITVGFLFAGSPTDDAQNDTGSQEETAVVYRHPLTGQVLDWTGGAVGPGDIARPLVFGVMVENSAEAWPLVGLDTAFLVIEAPVEANIPRFIAFISDDQDVNKIGPVRSARSYYLDWNDEFRAIYSHVGGSPEALNLIARYGTYDLNEFYQGEYYYRQNGTRYAPHNVYTNSNELAQAVEEIVEMYDLQDEPPSYDVWTFKNDEPTTETPVSFDLDWSDGSTYDLAWEYQVERNTYVRDQKMTSMFLENNAQAEVNNVIVMETTVTIVDEKGRRHLRTIGEGNAIVFQDGRAIETTWKKPSRTQRLRFHDANGNEIAMNAGKTWIEVVDDLAKVTKK